MYPGVHARQTPDKIAFKIAGSNETLTYAELEAQSNQVAHLLRALNVNPRDGITLHLPNCLEYLVVCWAAQRAGLYFTPISVLFAPPEIEYILDNSGARVLFTTRELVARLDPECLAPLHVILIDEDDYPAQRGLYPETPISDEAEGAEMVYSSGTTGKPKGVRFDLALNPLGTVAPLVATRMRMHNISSDTRYLSTAPLYHSAPLRYCLMVSRCGGSAVIMEKFSAEQALALIEAERITHSQWVPTMFTRLLRLPEAVRNQHDLSSLQYAIHAAAPCPVAIKQDMIDWWGEILYEYYSGTEANGQTAISSAEWLAHPGSVGRAIHGQLHILDDSERELPVGETGTVYFSGGGNFSYHKDPGKTAAARSHQGYTTLGDIGRVDEEGYLYLTDRKSFMIISGGVNIYPQEVEDTLIAHPVVADVAVIGVPNDEFGEEVKAVVELVDHRLANEDLAAELIAFCRQRLSHVKCPRSVDFTTTLPRHPTGKLYKKQLRDQYWQGHTSKVV